jgi:hypothetical protein
MKIIVAFFLLLLVSCKDNKKEKKMNNNEFSWSACVTSPNGYFAEVHDGYLATDNEPIASFVNMGNTNGIDWHTESNGITGSNKIPTNFSLTWLSYADKKFWKAQGQLPANKILALFKEGYRHTDMKDVRSKITYKRLVFGLAPGGHVVVWLGGLDQRVELASFQAKETYVDFRSFYRVDKETQQEMLDYFYSRIPQETQDYIKKHGLPIGKWETYRKRYNYRFVSKHYKPSVKELFERDLMYYNGEQEILQEGELDQHRLKAIPYKVRFYYKDDGLCGGIAIFNDQEMMEVFETMSKKHPNKPIDINVKVGFEYKDLTFTVVCGTTSLPLKKVVIERMFKGIID